MYTIAVVAATISVSQATFLQMYCVRCKMYNVQQTKHITEEKRIENKAITWRRSADREIRDHSKKMYNKLSDILTFGFSNNKKNTHKLLTHSIFFTRVFLLPSPHFILDLTTLHKMLAWQKFPRSVSLSLSISHIYNNEGDNGFCIWIEKLQSMICLSQHTAYWYQFRRRKCPAQIWNCYRHIYLVSLPILHSISHKHHFIYTLYYAIWT